MKGNAKMDETQSELMETNLKANILWGVLRAKKRIFFLYQSDVTWDDVREAQTLYDEAELNHQKARKAAGLPYYYVGCENE